MNTFLKIVVGIGALTIAFDLGGEYQKSVYAHAPAIPVVDRYPGIPDPNPPPAAPAAFDPSTARPVTPTWAQPQRKSNSATYTNVDGNTVQSPTFTSDGSAPVGATAQCRDGSWSFSQHHQGTCSHHGGVTAWQ
jgi:hypothetical protein